ncbi:MAG: hypothetical protein VX278_19895 [Myxococcota bacterium]|nr:hypothetical protein [Myxococcota bacterium]
MKKELVIAVILLALLAVFSFWPTPESDEKQIQRVIDTIESGMEEADLSMVMKQISEDYSDPQGMSKRAIRGILFQQFRKRGSLGITFSPMGIDIDGNRANVSLEALVIEGSLLGLSADADALHVEIELHKEDTTWRIVSHTRDSFIE